MTDDIVTLKHAFCAECGPVENTDEDGCCLTCGADVIVGTEFDKLMDAKETARAGASMSDKWISVKERQPTESDHPGDTVSILVRIQGTAKYHYPTKSWCWVDADWLPIPALPAYK